MLILLFDEKNRLLGEADTEKGSLRHLTLTPHGEDVLGARVRLWRTRGVPVNKHMETATSDGKTRQLVFFKEYVQTSSKSFADALQRWCSDVGAAAIELPDDRTAFWMRIAALPLEPEEQFVLLAALKNTAAPLLPEWDRALSDAELFSRHQQEDGRLAVQSLKRRMSAHLMGPFVNRKET